MNASIEARNLDFPHLYIAIILTCSISLLPNLFQLNLAHLKTALMEDGMDEKIYVNIFSTYYFLFL